MLSTSVSSSKRSRRATSGVGATNGNVSITAGRTSAHFDRNTSKAPFSVVAPTLPTGHSTNFANLYYFWKWTDAGGAKVAYGHTSMLDIQSDGSASYAVSVDLIIIDRLTGNRLDENGNAVSGRSGLVTLTVTNNNAATVWTVTKSGSAITAVNGGTTLHANESTGNDSTGNGTSGAPYLTLRRLIDANKAANQVWSIGAGTYSWTATVDVSAQDNWEFSAASGQSSATVILSQGAAPFAPFTARASNQRFVGYEISSTGTSGNQMVNALTTASNILFRDVKMSGFYLGFYGAEGTHSNLYFIGNNWTITDYFYLQGDRSEHVHFVSNTGRLASGSLDQSRIRINNSRYVSWQNNDFQFERASTVNYIIRNVGDVAQGTWWDNGSGFALQSYHYSRGNTFTNSLATAPLVSLKNAGESYPTAPGAAFLYYCSDNDIYVAQSGGPERFYIFSNVDSGASGTDVAIRNPQQGTSLGSLTSGVTLLSGLSPTRVAVHSQTAPSDP